MPAYSLSDCEVVEVLGGESIAWLLQCPICRGVPTPPIWNCVSGHIVCNDCRPNLHPQYCGLCRKPVMEGRNFFMEAVVNGSMFTCPFTQGGCDVRMKGEELKTHATTCLYGPKFMWVPFDTSGQSYAASDMVLGGHQNGVNLYVIRSSHMGSTCPGKLFECTPPGAEFASICWGGAEHPKTSFEVLIAKRGWYKWVESEDGNRVEGAIEGGITEDNEPLYIGRIQLRNDLVVGKVQPSREVCYVGHKNREKSSSIYEILVELRSRSLSQDDPSSGEDEVIVIE